MIISISTQSPAEASACPAAESPQPHRFTRDQYYQMGELGYFQDRRVELIDGEIVDMAPQKNPHVLCISLVVDALTKALGTDFWVRSQAPLRLVNHSEPEPDVAVVPGPKKSYTDHPTGALLVIEVSDTTLRFDRGKKASLYASAGIQDYWVVNLNNRSVELMREPVEDAQETFGWRYSWGKTIASTESISPLMAPQVAIRVADLLP